MKQIGKITYPVYRLENDEEIPTASRENVGIYIKESTSACGLWTVGLKNPHCANDYLKNIIELLDEN